MSMPAEKYTSMLLLNDLLHGIADAPPIPVTGVSSDSRRIAPGDVFFACQGIGSHGLDYAKDVQAAGAAAIVWDATTADAPRDMDIPLIPVANLNAHMGTIADRFYGEPSAQLEVVGVTGTNGKTTVAWMLSQCLNHLDARCGYLGTVGHGVNALHGDENMTTPPVIELHQHLADFVESQASHAAIEVSSHALSQNRVDGVRFAAALFTNLSRDHLDYHADMQDYFDAKARLFLECDPAIRVINVDTDAGRQLAAVCEAAIEVSTSVDVTPASAKYLQVTAAVANGDGTEVQFVSSWGKGAFTVTLPGDYNVANAALVLAYLLETEVPVAQACDVLAIINAPAGRMQRVLPVGKRVYVDYAHTPDALQSALDALRPHCEGKLWCVFGCGGDRDTGKRSMMGAVAEQFADHVVLTNDNPRTENPQAILDEIVAGCDDQKAVTIIADRAAAIGWTIAAAEPADVVLIAGKGHENFQDIGGERLPFADVAIARAALRGTGGEQ